MIAVNNLCEKITPPADGGCWGLMKFQVRGQTFGP